MPIPPTPGGRIPTAMPVREGERTGMALVRLGLGDIDVPFTIGAWSGLSPLIPMDVARVAFPHCIGRAGGNFGVRATFPLS